MNFLKKLYNRLFPLVDEIVEEEVPHVPAVEELQFRVVPFGENEYYVLQYLKEKYWTNMTRLYTWNSVDIDDDLNFPYIDASFDKLVEKAKQFKADPEGFKEFQDIQIEEYKKLRSENLKLEKHIKKKYNIYDIIT